jgi:hypothetical protein
VTVAVIFMGTNWLDSYAAKLQYMAEDAAKPIEQRPRYLTASTIVSEIYENDFLGKGSLSLQWNQGFANVYGKYFYLSDVGVIGGYYRYGIFLVFILLYYYSMFLGVIKVQRSKEIKYVTILMLTSSVALFYFDFNFLWGGQIVGILLAILHSDKYKLRKEMVVVR